MTAAFTSVRGGVVCGEGLGRDLLGERYPSRRSAIERMASAPPGTRPGKRWAGFARRKAKPSKNTAAEMAMTEQARFHVLAALQTLSTDMMMTPSAA
jgi:hypothetical protein